MARRRSQKAQKSPVFLLSSIKKMVSLFYALAEEYTAEPTAPRPRTIPSSSHVTLYLRHSSSTTTTSSMVSLALSIQEQFSVSQSGSCKMAPLCVVLFENVFLAARNMAPPSSNKWRRFQNIVCRRRMRGKTAASIFWAPSISRPAVLAQSVGFVCLLTPSPARFT